MILPFLFGRFSDMLFQQFRFDVFTYYEVNLIVIGMLRACLLGIDRCFDWIIFSEGTVFVTITVASWFQAINKLFC